MVILADEIHQCRQNESGNIITRVMQTRNLQPEKNYKRLYCNLKLERKTYTLWGLVAHAMSKEVDKNNYVKQH